MPYVATVLLPPATVRRANFVRHEIYLEMPLDCGLVARRAAGLFSFFMFWLRRRAMGVSGVGGSSLES